MKIEPVKYSTLMAQLMTPTPMNALRQVRSASPSSERRTPGAPAIEFNLLKYVRWNRVLPLFQRIVHVTGAFNLNARPGWQPPVARTGTNPRQIACHGGPNGCWRSNHD